MQIVYSWYWLMEAKSACPELFTLLVGELLRKTEYKHNLCYSNCSSLQWWLLSCFDRYWQVRCLCRVWGDAFPLPSTSTCLGQSRLSSVLWIPHMGKRTLRIYNHSSSFKHQLNTDWTPLLRKRLYEVLRIKMKKTSFFLFSSFF